MSTNPVDYGFAKRHEVVAVSKDDQGWELQYIPPFKPDIYLEVQRHIDGQLIPKAVDQESFNQQLTRCFEQQNHDTEKLVSDLGEVDTDLAAAISHLPVTEDLLETQDDAPIIRFINTMISLALRDSASDIHIEPYEDRAAIRFRIDGIMREIATPEAAFGPLLVSRIKVMSGLDIAEKRVPQDGRISLRMAGRLVDVRVSTLPSGHGERAVLRLLDKSTGLLSLDQLGLADNTRQDLNALLAKPHGIILVTGPTGSGKTTTLYAALNALNDRRRNILTVENPVEYFIDGIGQTQINDKVDMTFARGLRAILRQDPDVVMVGEIRDRETAEIAIQASLTGHLVFSTLHTNTAIGSVTRLRDMGIEPFLLGSSLIGVIAQRLVRRLCDHCKTPTSETPADWALPETATPHQPNGCERCGHTGYKGRIGVYELIKIDPGLAELVQHGSSESELLQHARQHSPGLQDDGIRLVAQGMTSSEELLRVMAQ